MGGRSGELRENKEREISDGRACRTLGAAESSLESMSTLIRVRVCKINVSLFSFCDEEKCLVLFSGLLVF